jgi:hypothetical protein
MIKNLSIKNKTEIRVGTVGLSQCIGEKETWPEWILKPYAKHVEKRLANNSIRKLSQDRWIRLSKKLFRIKQEMWRDV